MPCCAEGRRTGERGGYLAAPMLAAGTADQCCWKARERERTWPVRCEPSVVAPSQE